MNLVTVGYLAVIREVGAVVAGTDAAEAALIPVAEALNGKIQLAFDHAQIVRDAVERVGVHLDLTGLATAFVGPTFKMAQLRRPDRGQLGDPTGRRARPGAPGGKPAELSRAGRMWKYGSPIRRAQPNGRERETDESSCL
jgi:8-oxo-dGTP diphosphatase